LYDAVYEQRAPAKAGSDYRPGQQLAWDRRIRYMPATLTHAEFSRRRLLRLLDDLDSTPPADQGETIALPAGTELPAQALSAHREREFIGDHARRSETGALVFASRESTVVVSPPFPVTESFRAEGYRTEPLRALLNRSHRVAVVLLRLGGYAIGVCEGDQLVASRNDSRFVKNRHRKGGQSQRRFDRIREKQIHELFEHLCEDARLRLEPYTNRLDFLVYGGDRHTVQSFLKECRFLREYPVPVLPRFLTVPEPRHETLERLPALLTSSRVTMVEGGP